MVSVILYYGSEIAGLLIKVKIFRIETIKLKKYFIYLIILNIETAWYKNRALEQQQQQQQQQQQVIES